LSVVSGRANLNKFDGANLFYCGQLRDEFLRLILTVKESPELLE
jgi:hypothetical protein